MNTPKNLKGGEAFSLSPDTFSSSEEEFVEITKRKLIKFEFPYGLNEIDILDRVRLLTREASEDLDLVYTVAMAMLEDKVVKVLMKNLDTDKYEELGTIEVSDRDIKLGNNPLFLQYPYLLLWLLEAILINEKKKYPMQEDLLENMKKKK